MAVINIDDAYILGETGAQVDKVTGLFTKDEGTTSGEKSFAQLNICTAGSNRNLLDNPWFTVNQRGFTSGTSGYISDRWTILGGTPTITALSPYGISVATSSAYNFIQNCWFTEADIDGRTLTLSANIDGEIQSVTFTAAVNSYYSFNFNNRLDMFRIFTGSSATAHPQVRFTHNTGSATHNYTVYATKLEPGSVSTLANDAPPDYGEELAKCQRYFVRLMVANASIKTPIAFGFENAPTQCRFKLTTPVPLRTTPTPSTSGTFYLDGISGEHQVTSFASAAAVYLTTDGIVWAANSTELTAGAYILSSINGGYIDLSADL